MLQPQNKNGCKGGHNNMLVSSKARPVDQFDCTEKNPYKQKSYLF